ncbi:MAG: phosphatidylglycerol lysyltransferase domain-containing protein [Actinomycetes bacterium]
MGIWARRLEWAPIWVSRAVGLVGLVSIGSALIPAMSYRLKLVTEVLPSFTPSAARAATVAVGVALLMLAGGLRRRKHRAWVLSVALAGAAAVLHVLKGLDVEEATFSLAVLGLLLATRDAFVGHTDPRSWRHSAAVFLGSASAAVVVGTAAIVLDQDAPPNSSSFSKTIEHVLLGLAGLPGPLHFASTGRGTEVAITLAMLGSLVAILTIGTMLRPAGGPRALDGQDEARVRSLLAAESCHDSLGYFALRHDKSVIFSPSGKAAVAYRVVGGVSLAAGDPLGDPEAWPGAIDGWLAEARRYAWVPAVLAASERGAEAYHRAGLDALELGDEAVVDVDDFTLEGRAMRTVRQAVNRVQRQGYTCDVVEVSRLDDDSLAEVAQAADRWRDGATERGFAMALGRFGDPADAGCLVVRARDEQGRLAALLHLVPWGRHGLSLDLMRRAPGSENGVVELMVTTLVAAAPARGLRRISLNFAVFRSVFERGERLGAGPVLRLWRSVLLRASRFWQLESLYRANAKYRPVWEPRFLCFASARDLPRVTVSALRAEAFLVRPRFATFPRRTVSAPPPLPAPATRGRPVLPR